MNIVSKKSETLDIKDLRIEAAKLKDELKELTETREKLFLERKQHSDRIKALIASTRDAKRSRDELRTKIKDVKARRDVLNTEVREMVGQIKTMQPSEKTAERRERTSPGSIRAQIKKLEYRIETEGLSFSQEQRTMKQINQLKKQLDSAEDLSGQSQKARELSKVINEKKKEAKQLHREVREQADASQKHHEHLIAHSREIDDLKEKEQKAHAAFLEARDRCAPLERRIRELRKEVRERTGEEKGKRDFHDKETKKQEERRMQKELDRMIKEVEEKIAHSEKLTTEDLLIMQKSSSLHTHD